MNEFTLPQFSGPLDLLLSLIEEKKLSINEVSLSAVTDQFLQYITGLEEADPDELADFLVIAARLILMKSRALLPELLPDEDAGPKLADQLRLYQRFVAASKLLHERWLSNRIAYGRIEPPHPVPNPAPPANFDRQNLHDAMKRLLVRLQPPKPLPRTIIDRAITLKEKIDSIRRLLQERKSFSFQGALAEGSNRTDVIVGFLALLELVKQKVLTLEQDELFTDIMVHRSV